MQSRTSHQTMKLGKGKHQSPEQGACVMELASMLAGERFSDHPRSVSAVIAALLRTYNDRLDDERRQDLLAYASCTVGTAGSARIEDARMARLLEWGDELWKVRMRRSLPARLRHWRADKAGCAGPEAAVKYAFAALGKPTAANHATVLALVDELVAIGGRTSVDSDVAWVAAQPSTPPAATR